MKKQVNAGILDSAMFEMDKDVTKQIFHFSMYTTNEFSIELFKKSLENAVNNLPILKSILVCGNWRDKWVVVDNFKVMDILKIEYIDDIDFENEAYNYYLDYKDKNILPDKQPSFRVILIHGKNSNKSLVVFIVHHALAAPPGVTELINYVGKHYNACKNNTELGYIKNYRNLPKLFRGIGVKNVFRTVKHMLSKDKEEQVFQELCEFDYDNEGIGTFGTSEKLVVDKEVVKQLKLKYQKYGFTINDIMMLIVAKLIKSYNDKLPEKSTHILLSIGVGLKKYCKKDFLSISNYAGRDDIVLKYNEVDDIEAYEKKLNEFKKRPIGVVFMIPFIPLIAFPISKQKELWRNASKGNLQKWSNRSFSTTNVGSLDKWIEPFGSCVTDISFMASYGYSGLPLISASGFKGNLTFYFSKYKDPKGMCKDVREVFKMLIDKEVGNIEEK